MQSKIYSPTLIQILYVSKKNNYESKDKTEISNKANKVQMSWLKQHYFENKKFCEVSLPIEMITAQQKLWC